MSKTVKHLIWIAKKRRPAGAFPGLSVVSCLKKTTCPLLYLVSFVEIKLNNLQLLH